MVNISVIPVFSAISTSVASAKSICS